MMSRTNGRSSCCHRLECCSVTSCDSPDVAGAGEIGVLLEIGESNLSLSLEVVVVATVDTEEAVAIVEDDARTPLLTCISMI